MNGINTSASLGTLNG